MTIEDHGRQYDDGPQAIDARTIVTGRSIETLGRGLRDVVLERHTASMVVSSNFNER